MNSYTSLDVYCRHFGVVAADHSATVCFQVVGGLAVFDVDKERGTKRNELEELPASYERHAERNVVTVGRRRSQLVYCLTARHLTAIVLLIYMLLMLDFATDMLAPLHYSTLLLCA